MTRSKGEYTASQPEKIDSVTSAVLSASTLTVRSTVPASLLSSTVWRPAMRSVSIKGVAPRALPSTSTCAPEGVDVTCNAPLALRGVIGGRTATGLSVATRVFDGMLHQYRPPATPAASAVAATRNRSHRLRPSPRAPRCSPRARIVVRDRAAKDGPVSRLVRDGGGSCGAGADAGWVVRDGVMACGATV